MKEMNKDLLDIKIYDTREQLGFAAALDAATYINELLEQQNEVNILFAAAPSQNEFLSALQQHPITWSCINALHMDEYIGLKENDTQRFGNYLKRQIFDKVNLKSVHYLFVENALPEDICQRYSEILDKYPVDIVFMGIGENGHIAFNDPHVALFDDPAQVKIVVLDAVCREQQVHDGCFDSIEDVPEEAVTLTIPAMMKARRIFCIVPAASKANAVAETVNGEITAACPASILRTHKATTLYCDQDSAKYLI
ncbi:6-phosphogluconolactonase [Bacteroides sp. 51]|uniref:6-phosphogluconolactonase n=1 Tax=Bacteroides sp. 51 TaxID=2302938 RepID=UPI0019402495